MKNWVKESVITPSVEVEHVDGIPWYDASIPRKIHRCKPQTRGYYNWVNYVERCACGAIRLYKNDRWIDKNSRKR